MNDNQIIELFFERSENALTELSEKYSKTCHKIAFNILGNEADAQECVNDAFLGIWNTIPPECPDKLSAFIYKVVRNVSLKKLRSNTAKKRNSYEGYILAFKEGLDAMGQKILLDKIYIKELDTEALCYTAGDAPDRITVTFVFDNIMYSFTGQGYSLNEIIKVIKELE